MMTPDKKKCTKCKKFKDATEFHWRSAKHQERMTVCKDCKYTSCRQWQKKNRSKLAMYGRRDREKRKKQDLTKYRRHIRDEGLRKKYGITIEQYDAVVVAQDGVCAICGCSETRQLKNQIVDGLSVDHDHDTKKNRGLLCSSYNNGLGRFKHDPERLEKATAYMRYHRK